LAATALHLSSCPSIAFRPTGRLCPRATGTALAAASGGRPQRPGSHCRSMRPPALATRRPAEGRKCRPRAACMGALWTSAEVITATPQSCQMACQPMVRRPMLNPPLRLFTKSVLNQ
jgi:hypothetical protein